MKSKSILFIFSSIVVFTTMDSVNALAQPPIPKYEMAVSQDFYNNIVYLDSIFFHAYNRCNIAVMDSLMSEDLEFYHDKGGFSNSKTQTMEAVKKNICGRVTRELLPGSIEVYEIHGYGAVQIGFHGFRNNQEQQPVKTRFSKFVHIWRFHNNRWQITRVISLH